jgi:hypothetical protein
MASMRNWEMEMHKEGLARALANQDPRMEQIHAEAKRKVGEAMAGMMRGGRQNRSTASDEPISGPMIDHNPMGAFAGRKKGK